MKLAARRRRLIRGIELSCRLLMARPLRTALSVSGIVVGVAAVVVMAALSEGAKRRVLTRVQAMGSNLLVVNAAPAPALLGRPRQVPIYTTLRIDDARMILDESTLAVAAAPAVFGPFVVRAGDVNTTTTVLGTTAEGLGIRNIRAARGDLFENDDHDDRRRVALLGPTVVRILFGTSDPVGAIVRIGAVPFEVVGVTRALGVDPAGVDQDNRVVVPLGTAVRRLFNVPYVHALYVQAGRSDDLEALEREVRTILGRRLDSGRGAPDSFVIQNQAVLLRTERGTVRTMTQLLAAVVAATLLLGTSGIVAGMLISIRDRIGEIGLRRAVGATRRDIRRQFIIESALLATAGGVGGIAAGTIIAAMALLFGPWDLVMPWRAIVLAFGSPTAAGVIIGVIPAARAAKLEPTIALRWQ
jgi:putative ABC transport system permease protein